jgi:hypothetical protein
MPLSLCICILTYFLICSSSRPIVLTQYPFAQKCRPQYRFFNSRCISNILMALLPFKKPTVSDTENFGGTDKTRCTWSAWTLPSKISIPFHSQSCRIISRRLRPTCPCNILNRYFGHQTTWYLHSHTACDNLLKLFNEYLLLSFRVTHPEFNGGILFNKPLTYPHSKAGTISVADGLMG